MDYPIYCCTNHAEFETIWKDLKRFGERGHERIELRTHRTGAYYPCTMPKRCGGFLGLIWRILRLFSWKPETSRQAVVARAVCDFLDSNQQLLQAHLSELYLPPSQNSQNSIQHPFLNLAAFDRLFSDKAQAVAKKWFALKDEIHAQTLKARDEGLVKAVRAPLDREREAAQKSLQSEKSIWQEKSRQHQETITTAIRRQEELNRELISTSQKDRQLYMHVGEEIKKYLIGHVDFLDNLNPVSLGQCIDPQIAYNLELQYKRDRQEGDMVLLCKEGGKVRIDSHILKIFYPDSSLTGLAQFVDAQALEKSEDGTSKAAEGLTLRVDKEEKIDLKDAGIKHVVHLTEDYTVSEVELLVDFLYGRSRSALLTDLRQMLTLMEMTHRLCFLDLHAECRHACIRLFSKDPSKVIDAFHTLIHLDLGEKTGSTSQKVVALQFLETQFHHLKNFPQWAILKDVLHDKKQMMVQLFEESGYLAGLGWCYKYGMGVSQDNEQAVSYLKQTTCPFARLELAHFYENGLAVEKNLECAMVLIKQAADAEFSPALYALGAYHKGKDVKLAIEYFQKAADYENADALNALGECYRKGVGLARDPVKAFEFFKRAARQNHAQAQANLGVCYEEEEKNKDLAAKLYRKASVQYNAMACYRLYKMQVLTYHIPVSGEALEFLQRAAAARYAPAQCDLGAHYELGTGLPVDPQRAFKLYLAAAGQQYTQAQEYVGVCYTEGRGVEIDWNCAAVYLKLAAAQGSTRAQDYLRKLGLND